MAEVIRHWVYTLFGAFLIGPLAGVVAGGIRGVDGAAHASGLVGESPVAGMLRAVVCVALAGITLLIGGAMGFVRRALFVSGIVLAWAAMSAGTVEGIIRATGGEGIFLKFAIEGVILGSVFAFFVLALGKIAKRRDDSFVMPSKNDTRSIAANVIVGMVLVWAFAQSGSEGQVLFAAFVAGLFGTIAGRVVEPASSPLAPALAGAVLCALAPLVSLVMSGGSSLSSLASGEIAGFAMLTPLTWLAGISLGIWGGASWADSIVKKHVPEHAGGSPRRVARG